MGLLERELTVITGAYFPAADEVAGHREVEAIRCVRLDDLRLPAQQVGQEPAADDRDVATGAGRAAVAVDADEDVAPPRRIAERVADDVVRRFDRGADEPAVDEAVVVHRAIVRL